MDKLANNACESLEPGSTTCQPLLYVCCTSAPGFHSISLKLSPSLNRAILSNATLLPSGFPSNSILYEGNRPLFLSCRAPAQCFRLKRRVPATPFPLFSLRELTDLITVEVWENSLYFSHSLLLSLLVLHQQE